MNVFSNLCKGPAQQKNLTMESQPSFRSTMEDVWQGGAGLITRDLPRLGSRTTVYVNGTERFQGGDFSKWEAVVTLFQVLAEFLEEEKYPSIVNILEEAKSREAPHDLALAVSQLLEQCELNEYNTPEFVYVLQACVQTLVYEPSFKVTTELFDNQLLKDVRSTDGWRLIIRLFDDRISVSHVKKQQNLEPVGSAGHLVIQWELLLSFERNMQTMAAATLQLTNVEYNENMDEETKNHWNNKLSGGNIRLA